MTGSGKTTLARRLGELTGIPWHEADQLTWEPGWVQVSDEEQRSRIQAICDQDAWILDTAYGKWIDVPLARAELIVALDYPRWVSLGWLIKRTLARATDREPVCNGNQESWKLMFSRDSILLWHFKSFRRKRARISFCKHPPPRRRRDPHYPTVSAGSSRNTPILRNLP